jgi:two-component system alkaline phosphatase synthesis response regulator PhoP
VEKTKILVVDDEKDAVSALQFRLEKAGYEVLTAEHGAAALDILRDHKVDLILAHFMMPELNGLELARMVKANPNWFETRIILFSCNTDPEFRKRALDIGALDYLPKTEGYGNIIQRIGEVAAVKRPSPVPAPVEDDIAEDPPDEQSYREQLRSLSQSLVDVLHLGGLNERLPDSARYALGSAQRIAEDIQRVSGSASQIASKDEIPHGR